MPGPRLEQLRPTSKLMTSAWTGRCWVAVCGSLRRGRAPWERLCGSCRPPPAAAARASAAMCDGCGGARRLRPVLFSRCGKTTDHRSCAWVVRTSVQACNWSASQSSDQFRKLGTLTCPALVDGPTHGGPTDAASSSLLTTTAAADVEDNPRPGAGGGTLTEPGFVSRACPGADSAGAWQLSRWDIRRCTRALRPCGAAPPCVSGCCAAVPSTW
jgi:hypothetical protein